MGGRGRLRLTGKAVMVPRSHSPSVGRDAWDSTVQSGDAMVVSSLELKNRNVYFLAIT